jgi:hypothetical protein
MPNQKAAAARIQTNTMRYPTLPAVESILMSLDHSQAAIKTKGMMAIAKPILGNRNNIATNNNAIPTAVIILCLSI